MCMALCSLSFLVSSGCAQTQEPSTKESTGNAGLPKVYFIKEINSGNLVKVYEALGRKSLEGKVAVKLSTGEPGGHNFLQPALIAPLVKEVNGTIVECNTAYGEDVPIRSAFEGCRRPRFYGHRLKWISWMPTERFRCR